MKSRAFWAFIICVAIGLVTGVAFAQTTDAKKPSDKPAAGKPADSKGPEGMAMDPKTMALMTPGASHAYLKPFEGKWSYAMKGWMAPEQPWGEDKGTAEYKLMMGGRYLVQDVKSSEGSKNGMPPFEGHGITGYDNFNKRFFNVWVDNMGTGVMNSTGKTDDGGKTITMTGEYDDPMTGKKQKVRSVLKNLGPEKHVFEMYNIGEDGKEFKGLEVTYTKK